MDSSLPQGSTLGPLMYIIYASELQAVAERQSRVPQLCRRHIAE